MVRTGAGTLAALVCALGVGLGAAGQDKRGTELEPQDTDRAKLSGCAGLSVKATPKKGTATQGFSARQILDLNFRVRLLASDTPSTLEMRYFTPGNHLDQSVLVPVATEASAEVERSLSGYPFPVKVSKVEPDPDVTARGAAAYRSVLAPAFPVAGTMIVNNSLYGVWRAEAWLEGASAPCSVSFAIKP
jgi:hypothetical protein